jgi:hypothetical protein
MKRFLTTIVLACVLSVSVLAGQIPTDGSPTPSGTTQTTPAGDIPSVGQSALTFIQTVVGLLM